MKASGLWPAVQTDEGQQSVTQNKKHEAQWQRIVCQRELWGSRLGVQCSAYCAVRLQYAVATADCATVHTVADDACQAACVNSAD